MFRPVLMVLAICCGVASAQAPPQTPAAVLLQQVQATMLERDAGTKPFHIRLELTQVSADGKTVATGFYDETWFSEQSWHREAQLGDRHGAQENLHGTRNRIMVPPLDDEGVTLSMLSAWAVFGYEGDADAAVVQHIVSHAPGRDVPMIRIGTRSVLPDKPFRPDALAWYVAEDSHEPRGLMDGDFFVEYFDRESFRGKTVARHWTVMTDSKVFLKAKLLLLEDAKLQ